MKKLMLAAAVVAFAVNAQAITTYYMKTTYDGSSVTKATTTTYYTMWTHAYANLTQYGIPADDSMNTAAKCNALNNYFLGVVAQGATAWQDAKKDWIDSEGHPYVNEGLTTVSEVDYIKFTRERSTAKNNYAALFFCEKDGIEYFRVAVSHSISTSSEGIVDLKEGSAGVWGDWHVAVIPEPTSGLLMLLGVAGLALKRKRA